MKVDPRVVGPLSKTDKGQRFVVSLPLSAPKQEKSTIAAKIEPPTGQNKRRPKSKATVLLIPTIV